MFRKTIDVALDTKFEVEQFRKRRKSRNQEEIKRKTKMKPKEREREIWKEHRLLKTQLINIL